MSDGNSSQQKKDAFRQYLEKTGVIDAITKVLVALYEEPERPQNALDYVKKYMGHPSGHDSAELKNENELLRKDNHDLKKTIEGLKEKLGEIDDEAA